MMSDPTARPHLFADRLRNTEARLQALERMMQTPGAGPVQSFRVVQAAFNDGTNSGQRDFTYNFPKAVGVAGWTVITGGGEFGFSAGTVNGVAGMLYTNYAGYNAYGGGSSAAIQTTPVGPFTVAPSTWHAMTFGPLVFPITAASTPSFVLRWSWTPNGSGVWMDHYASVEVYAL